MESVDVYLALGSNLGDRHSILLSALYQLSLRVGRLVRCSSFIETEPWGFQSEHTFLNAVALFHTNLTPHEVLSVTKVIERELGRLEKTEGSYKDRTIDIDILLYGDEHINEADLKIPHPLMYQRDFVMIPLQEIKNSL